MNDLPENLKYARTHEWALWQEDGVVRVGITDFAQQQLGDLVFIGLPDVGRNVAAGEQCAVVESVKTASDLHSPVTGEIVDINTSLQDEPEQINDSPYQAWIFAVRAADAAELDALLDAAAYENTLD
ncbi:glycine cleavage system protein GcvH [Methylovulum psychrotolerans]|uniref:Glycine cleavage system H protein n=1 Tax=Methylovulum psychrotolerans TaxID=1704499 RepID=A0A1Z4C0E9_9GAMM|nr:glycine cleavage system protein GcvH [Methylovulum psychrotolerans]ASF46981.1 glycine cleavage system protein H [Methylovulum psychrotolerans]